MKTKVRNIPLAFEPEIRFEVPATPAAPFRGELEAELEQLKGRLLRQTLQANPRPAFEGPLRRALNEAASIAWMTPFPLLVLPTLAEEKAAVAIAQARRQQRVFERSRSFIVEVA